MFTYLYPSLAKPRETRLSAAPLIVNSLISQANLFQEFQPMGGRLPSPLFMQLKEDKEMDNKNKVVVFIKDILIIINIIA